MLCSKILGARNTENVLILHGLYGNYISWLHIGRKLSQNYKIHLLNLRNHGDSPYTDEFNYSILVEDVYIYLKINKIAKCFLIGHSLGGKISMFFADKYPNLVMKIIVVDISPKNYNSLLDYEPIVEQHLNLISILNSEEKTFFFKNYEEIKYISKNKFNLKSITENLSEIMNGLNAEDYENRKIETPALFLKASNSNYIKKEDEKMIKYIFPISEIIEIENTTHLLHIEQPDIVFEKIFRFLNATNN